MSKIIIKWSTFSYLLSAALSLTQQVIFTYYLTAYSPMLWSVLAIDILSIFYILYNSTPRRLVIRGVKCWATHTRLLISKVIMMYLFILPKGMQDKSLIFRGYIPMEYEITLVNSFTVLIYVLWIFHVGTIIYNGIHKISIEHMLHIELVLRVFIDLLDIIDAVHNFLFEKNVRLLAHFVLFGYVISLYLHGYSFPCMGVEKYLNSSESSRIISMGSNDGYNSSGDVRYCRKNAIIVGTIIDMLIGSCRIIAIYMTKNTGFSIFLIKNIYSIIMYFGLFRSISIIPELLKTKELMQNRLSDKQFDLRKKGTMKPQFSNKSTPFDKIVSQNYLWSTKKLNKNYFNKPDVCLGPTLFEYLYKLITSFEFSFKTDLHHFLNPTCVQFDSRFRIIFPYLFFIFFKILSVCIFSFSTLEIQKVDFITAYLTGSDSVRTYGHVIIAFIGFMFLVNFLSFVTISSFFDAIFSGFFAAIRFLSFIAMLSLFSQSHLLDMILANISPYVLEVLGRHIICIFAILPCINLLSNMYTFISAILGKQLTSFVILSKDSFGDAQNQVGVIPTNTLVLLVTAQNMLLPKSMYKFFSGSYLVSTFRLNIMLSWVHTRRIFIAMYIRLLLLLSVENANYYIYIPIFGTHAFLLLYYLFSTQIVCYAIINKTENQINQNSIEDMDDGSSDFKSGRLGGNCKLLPNLLF